jgi:hypothetical protein
MVDDQAEEGDDLARELGHQLLLASSEGDKPQVGRLLDEGLRSSSPTKTKTSLRSW